MPDAANIEPKGNRRMIPPCPRCTLPIVHATAEDCLRHVMPRMTAQLDMLSRQARSAAAWEKRVEMWRPRAKKAEAEINNAVRLMNLARAKVATRDQAIKELRAELWKARLEIWQWKRKTKAIMTAVERAA